jgi:hypothetical protein
MQHRRYFLDFNLYQYVPFQQASHDSGQVSDHIVDFIFRTLSITSHGCTR